MDFFKASNKNIAHMVWKDGQDKQEMKETIKNMAQYINDILHPEAKPINEMSAIVDVTSTSNQQLLDNLQKCKVIAKTIEEWVQGVLDDTIKKINLLDKASKDIFSITKRVELSNEGYEKERNNWAKVMMWLEDIQEFGLQKFQAECLIASLDEKTLYVIKDYIEWKNEALVQGMTKIKEILQGLKVIHEII